MLNDTKQAGIRDKNLMSSNCQIPGESFEEGALERVIPKEINIERIEEKEIEDEDPQLS